MILFTAHSPKGEWAVLIREKTLFFREKSSQDRDAYLWYTANVIHPCSFMPSKTAPSAKTRSTSSASATALSHESWFVITILAVLASVLLMVLTAMATMRDTMQSMQAQIDTVSAMSVPAEGDEIAP